MLSLLVSLTVLGGAPRGLAVKDHADLVTQVDTRLPKWLVLGGDRKALLANKKEIAAYLDTLPVAAADRKRMAAAVLEEQALPSGAKSFDAVKALVRVKESQTTVGFFDGQGNQCSAGFFSITGKPGGRLVLLGGPLVDQRPLESELESAKRLEAKVDLFEKKDGAWVPMAIPAPPPPPAPTCTDELKKAAKSVYLSEKSYFAETDSYSNDLAKVGIDVKSLGASSVKVDVKGAAEKATFTAEVAMQGGVARIDDTGAITIVKPCTP